jgi:hypothetical protein
MCLTHQATGLALSYVTYPDDVEQYCHTLLLAPVFVTGRDLYWSFAVVAFKP